MKHSRRNAKWLIAALVVAFLAIQLFPVGRTNPPVESEVPATPEVRALLRRACYDCHSNETVWPAYSRVAPVSWLIAHDVKEGREHLNFSTWDRLTRDQQLAALSKAWGKVEQGEMPLWLYVPLHPAARLSDTDRSLLHAWSLSEGSHDTIER